MLNVKQIPCHPPNAYQDAVGVYHDFVLHKCPNPSQSFLEDIANHKTGKIGN